MPEVIELGTRCTKTSKAIYDFLNKRVGSAEPFVVAAYRHKFDARVNNLCLDMVADGLTDVDDLMYIMKPAESLFDFQWIARGLASNGEGWSAQRLEQYYEAAGEKLKAQGKAPLPFAYFIGESEPSHENQVEVEHTPDELWKMIAGVTDVEAQLIVDRVVGNYMTVSGPVFRMAHQPGQFSLVASEPKPSDYGLIYLVFREGALIRDDLSIMHEGDQITVRGRMDQLTTCGCRKPRPMLQPGTMSKAGASIVAG
ncbi:MAG: hypothetical protein ABSH29_12670 [Acidimicrobiales bacterium]|jgi:hypothetical protein